MRKTIELLRPITKDNPEADPKELSFCCPDCGSPRLRVIVTGVRLSRDVYGVYEDGTVEFGELDGPIDNEDDGLFYECAACLYTLQQASGNLVGTEHDLVKWLKENCNGNMNNAH
jgi:hypothetical protein